MLNYVSEDYLESVSYHNFENNELQSFKVNNVRRYENNITGTVKYFLTGKATFDKLDDYQDVTIEMPALPKQFEPLFR